MPKTKIILLLVDPSIKLSCCQGTEGLEIWRTHTGYRYLSFLQVW